MTREEKQKTIDALKISAPIMAMTQDKFNDYIQTINKVMNWLEQEPETVTEFADRCQECGAKYGKMLNQYKAFAEWVASEIFDENWEDNKDAFVEIACRKLEKLGIVRVKGDEWELVESQESEVKEESVLDKVRAEIIFGELIDFKNGKISSDDVIDEFNRVTRLEVLKIIDKYNKSERESCEDMGEVSDGYHTFNQLYHQRAILFATIVNQNKNISWKSYKHSDGKYCFDRNGEWFIVGIDTPDGSYTYHYSKEYWDYFDCKELDCGKEWDGHTEEDVTRLLSLSRK